MVGIVSGNSLGLSATSLAVLGQRGPGANATHGRGNEAVFVNVATGNLVIGNQDDFLVSRGLDFAAVRTYNSQGLMNDDNGDNWTAGFHQQHIRLTGTASTAGSTLTRIDRDGSSSVYAWSAASSSYVNTDGSGAYDQIRIVGNEYVWKDGESGRQEKSAVATGLLTHSIDLDGNTTTYAYTNGLISQVTTASGETVRYDYSGNNLVQVRTTNASGAESIKVRYSYDASSRLVSVKLDLTPEDGSIADGKFFETRYTYDGTSKRVATLEQTDGTRLAITYAEVGGQHRVASYTDALGQTTSFSYNLAAKTTVVTDPLGRQSTYGYDASGQLTQVSTPLPNSGLATTTYAYDASGNLTQVTDPSGRTARMEYDANGNAVLERDSVGNTVIRSFNALGKVVRETRYTQPDPDGSGPGQPGGALTTRYVYDEANKGRLRFALSAEGRVTEYRYNTFGDLTSTLAYRGGLYAVSGLAVDAVPTETQLNTWVGTQNLALIERTDYLTDLRGQVQSITTYTATDAAGNGLAQGKATVLKVFDQRGRLLQTTSGNGFTEAYVYDGLGRVITTTDRAGNVSVATYDDAGNRTTVVAANGLQTIQTFDRAGRLISVQQRTADQPDLGTTRYHYDANGRLLMAEDPTGARTWSLYDEGGRKSADIDASGSLVEYRYDSVGRLVRTVAYVGAVNGSLLVDAQGKPSNPSLTAIRPSQSPADKMEWRAYDAAGRLWKTIDRTGSVTENVYDGASRIVSTRQYASPVATVALADQVNGADITPVANATADRITRSFYDAEGLLRGTLDAEGFLVSFAYNAAGRLTKTTRHATATAVAQRATGTYESLKPADNAKDLVEYRLYDGRGLLVGQVDAGAYLTEFAYDASGNLTSTKRYSKALAASVLAGITPATTVAQIRPATNSLDQTVVSEYDRLDRLKAQIDYLGTRTEYLYDTAGNLVQKTAAAGTDEVRRTMLRFDVQGRVIAELSPVGAALISANATPAQVDAVWAQYGTTHAYDAAGRRIRTTDPNGLKTLFFYTGDGRLTHTVNSLGEVTETRYDGLDRVTARISYASRIDPSALAGANAGGLTNPTLLALINAAADPARDRVEQLSYGSDGTLASVRDAEGFTRSYAYNAFKELTQRTEANGAVFATTYDRRGLVLSEARDTAGVNAVVAYQYDAFGQRTLSTDALGNTIAQTFDKLGRVLTVRSPHWYTTTYKYDAFGRVISEVNGQGGTTTYAYSPATRSVSITSLEGLVIKKTFNRHGEVVITSDYRGNTTNYTYNAQGQLTGTSINVWKFDSGLTETVATAKEYDAGGRIVADIDANGTRTVFTYDGANRVLTKTVDPSGLALTTQYSYDTSGRQLSVTNPNGVVTQFKYDRKGQLLEQVVDPSGLNLVTKYSYDAKGNTVSQTAPGGVVTTYTYDKLGRRTKEQLDPSGLNLTRTYAYDKNDNVVLAVDANGNNTFFGYDKENRQTLRVDGDGRVEETAYDGIGRVLKIVKYEQRISTAGLADVANSGAVFGPSSGMDGAIRTRLVNSAGDWTEYRSYDANNFLQSTVNSLGEVTTYMRDENGNVAERRRYVNRIVIGGASGWSPGTLPTPERSVLDEVTRTAYDALGRAIVSVNSLGHAVHMKYDAVGNVIEKIAYAQAVPVSNDPYDESYIFALPALAGNPANVVTRYGYDKANRLAWTVDGTGGVSRNAYDKNGNLIKTVRLATPANLSNPSAPGFIESATDVATDHVYDAAGRRTFTVNALGGVTQFGYDANGNLTQRLEYAVNVTPPSASLGFVFGPTVGNYTQANIRSALGASADTHPMNRLTQYAYDGANRQVVSVDAMGGVTRVDYGVNTVTTVRYAQPISTQGLSTTSRPQDLESRLQTSAEDRRSVQILDAAGRTVLSIDAQGYASGAVFDGAGRVVARTAYAALASGNQAVATPALDRTTQYRYDAAGRLVSTTDPMQGVETYGYDALGNKTSFVNKNGNRWDYEYDVAGRMVKELSPQVQLTAVTQAAGGVLQVDSAATTTQRVASVLAYDNFGNLIARTEAAGRPEERTTRYEFDALGRQIKVLLPVTGIYDAANDNLLSNGVNGNASRVETAQQLWTETRYDMLGNAVAGRDAAGNWSYKAYDRAGQLTYELDAEGFVTGYTRNRWGEAEVLVRFGERSTLSLGAGTAPSADTLRMHMASKSRASDREISSTFDRMGRVLQVQEPLVWNLDSDTGVQSQGRKTTLTTYNAFGDAVVVRKNLGDSKWATTVNAVDRLGRMVSSQDAMGYFTTWSYDSVGNVVRKIEFASQQSSAASTPDASKGDRITDYTYDLLSRKTAETRRGVEFSGYSQSGAIEKTRGDVTTQYDYDAVGNLVCTTDALGGKTYSFYDALGRVKAVVSPTVNTGVATNGGAVINPLTTFDRDAHGNVLKKTDWSAGALNLSAAGFTIAADGFRDRVSLSRFDVRGMMVQSADATGAQRSFSYDASGQIAKEWQNVTVIDSAGNTTAQTLWRGYRYDKLGRQVAMVQPLQKGVSGALTLGETATAYNAFGEVTLREVRDGSTLISQEKYEYDNAGRVWRSNAGDGVTKVWAYNIQGQQTAQLVASGSISLDTFADAQAALQRQWISPNQFRRTDMQYDALGRMTKLLEPERVSDQSMSLSTRQDLIWGTVSASSTNRTPSNVRNQVDLVWRSIENLGSGDVRISLTYTSDFYDITDVQGQSTTTYPPVSGQRISVTVSAEEASEGYVLKWDNTQNTNYGASGNPQGISSIQNIKVEKKDIFGRWQTLYNVAPDTPKLTTNWTQATSPGYIWSDNGDGRVPIYRLYDRYNDTHYFTTSASDRSLLVNQPGWSNEGVSGYVSSASGPGLVPMYRLTKPGPKDAIYSLYARESELPGLTAQGWTNRGIDGYVGDPNARTPGGEVFTAANHPLGMVRLYSLQNNRSLSSIDGTRSDGLYTTSLSDVNALLGIKPPAEGQVNNREVTRYAAFTGLSIEVTYPQDLISETKLLFRKIGETEWRTAPDSSQAAFGSAWRFNVGQLGLAVGTYEYKVTNTSLAQTLVRDVGSGIFNIYGVGNPDQMSAPPLTGVQQSTANIDGTFYRTLQWPKPSADWTVTFQYKPVGSEGPWIDRVEGSGVFSYGDGRTSGMGIGMQGVALNMGAGSFEYQVVAVNRATGAMQRATGTLSVPPNVVAWDSTAPIQTVSGNVRNLGLVGYVWNSPAPGRVPLYRYYMAYNNQHHVTTADPSVIAFMNSVIAEQNANPSMPTYVWPDGIIGYVETSPSSTNQRLYQYRYGNENIYRLTANPADIGSFQTLYSAPPADYPFQPGVWYQSAYQFDGYISKTPAAGTTPLYAVYNGDSFGPLSLGDFLTSTNEYEVKWILMRGVNTETANVPGVRLSTAQISGQHFSVLQWSRPPADARVTVLSSPPIPMRGNPATFFTHGDAYGSQFSGGDGQGIPLDTLEPGGTYTISVVVEYAATAQRNAYKARTDFTINVPAAGASGAVTQRDTTPAYVPADRVNQGTAYSLTSRAITSREFDRWGNTTAVEDPRVLNGAGTQRYKTTFTYNSNNQLVTQTQAQSFGDLLAQSETYYDKLGRELGTRDGEGRLTVSKVYDAAGNLVQERFADGGRTDHGFNAFGERVRQAQVFDANRTVVTNYSYDKASRLVSTSLERAISRYTVTNTTGDVQGPQGGDANNGVTKDRVEQTVLERVEYDEAGRRVRSINGADESTRYIYDRAGNIVLTGQETALRPLGNATLAASAPLKYTMRYSYDALSRKTEQIDGNNLQQTWSYDSAKRLIGRTDRSGQVTYSYAYNLAGQLTHEENNAQLKKSLDYRYDGAGQLTRIVDNFLGQTSSYAYDLAGNRISERVTQKTRTAAGEIADVTYQDNRLFYDAQNRLRAVMDGRADVRIDYDRAGNRTRVQTRVLTQSGGPSTVPTASGSVVNYQYSYTPITEQDNSSVTFFSYDVMNRQQRSEKFTYVSEQGFSTYAQYVQRHNQTNNLKLEEHNYVYDLAGNRINDNGVFIKGAAEGGGNVSGSYSYTYDDLRRLVSYSGYGIAERQTNEYDGAGRTVYSMSLVRRDNSWAEEHRYTQYDATGKVQDVRAVVRNDQTKSKMHVDDVRYHDTTGSNAATDLGYDDAGNLKGLQQISDGTATTTRYEYQHNGGYLQTKATTQKGSTTGVSETWRDANGFISNITEPAFGDLRMNRAFVNDAQGNALYINQAAGQEARLQNLPGGYLGGFVGDSYSPGHIQRQLVAVGQVLGRYGDAPKSMEQAPKLGMVPKYAHTAEFELAAPALRKDSISTEPQRYTASGGESLREVARNVLGDGSLWWRIAEANALGIAADAPLVAGQSLLIPSQALSANRSDTLTPYEPGKATGSLDPTLPMPASKDKCGGMGRIIMAVVAIVVAVYAPQFLGQMGITNLTTGAAGTGSLTGLGGAVGGAAGSIASQVVGVAIGAQEKFSWKGVAMAAIGGGFSAGLPTEMFNLTESAAVNTALRMATANALTQGVGVVTGLQKKFDWRGVAASAAGSYVGAKVPELLPKALDPFASRLITGLAAGTATAVMRGGKVAIQQVAVDAFGNALGYAIAGAMQSQPSTVASASRTTSEPFVHPSDPSSGVSAVYKKLMSWSEGGSQEAGMRDVLYRPGEDTINKEDVRWLGKPEMSAILGNWQRFMKYNMQSPLLNPDGVAVADIIRQNLAMDGLGTGDDMVGGRALTMLGMAAQANVSKAHNESMQLIVSQSQNGGFTTEYMLAKAFLAGLAKDLGGTFQEGGQTYNYFGNHNGDWADNKLLSENMNVPAYRDFYNSYINPPSSVSDRLKSGWPAFVPAAVMAGSALLNRGFVPGAPGRVTRTANVQEMQRGLADAMLAESELLSNRPTGTAALPRAPETRNGYTYSFDPYGRVVNITGNLTSNPNQARNQQAQLAAGGADRLPTDDGGHYVGRRFDGPIEDFNHFAQDANFNRGAYKRLENSWQKMLGSGQSVTVDITPSFMGESLRPLGLDINYKVNGVPYSKTFMNRRGG